MSRLVFVSIKDRWILKNSSRVDRGFKAQGLDRKKLVYHSGLQPWLSMWGIFWLSLFILINGFQVFWSFNASGFLTACTPTISSILHEWTRLTYTSCADINIPLFAGLYLFWKFYKKTKVWKPEDMDFVTVRISSSDLLFLFLRNRLTTRCRGFPQSRRLNFRRYLRQPSWRRSLQSSSSCLWIACGRPVVLCI